ncbi:MAG: TlpA family protein disulfide reductase [Proteobacteria bacterium]|jgi:peroxiredoxin|nr:redoxin [Methylibium sp.]MBY0366023.1 TlpA family protein disulfide reductase [Burkholderiaceae bacterium]MCH8854916.1 TlpA family protein disulfide reductase [Pseudomonadota bacterium]RTL18580.1 MAG: TlpA family protein disulfide reductase [Burkholderiales bacterium]|mmetsp:Transcript_9919/g.23263  ORF Transcript_9919/g.23263 Transcript_9919/m.23263 type:complete len:164 (-) Transcript_9919:2420-2911(-)
MPSRRALVSLALAIGATMLGGCARERAPAVDYVLLNGQKASSRDWQGKVMLVNFWATSCTTCVAEMPQIIATHERFKARGFDTVAVAMSYDPPAFVAKFAETRRLPFGVAIDNTGAVAGAFGQVQMTPTTFLVNKRGEIVKRFVGQPDFAALHGLIEQLLAEA